MSGVAAIRYLLAHDTAVLAVVPATKIMAGDLPLGTVLPAIAVTLVSGTPRTTLAMSEAGRMHTDRVQVTPHFNGPRGASAGTGYPGLTALLKLVLAACPQQRGTIDGVVVEAIIPDTEGPDLSDPAIALYSRSRDFIVRWKES